MRKTDSYRSGSGLKRSPLFVGITSAMALTLSGITMADSSNLDLNIKGQKVGPALMELGQRAGVQIIVPQGVGNSLELSGISGQYTLAEALNKMLQGSGFEYEFTSDDVVAIKAVEQSEDGEGEAREEEVEELIVTGTRIKGVETTHRQCAFHHS